MPRTSRSTQVFSYCIELELALNELLGPRGKWNGLAGSFANYVRVRQAVLDATKVIRKRLNCILTVDDRLRLTTEVHLDEIERLAKGLTADGRGLLPLLSNFIHLVALLLGYDWLGGKPNREVIYYQTLEHQLMDDSSRHPSSALPVGRLEYEQRCIIVKKLYSEGLRVSQVARVLNQPESLIKDILVRKGVIGREKNIKKT